MKVEFDPAKSERNARERGLPFDLVGQFDWEDAMFSEGIRFDYPETRVVAFGLLDGRVHVVCFTSSADGIGVISFRKANDREVRRYEKEKVAHR